jgi:pyruvate dehydrogenase E1 component alpha subunit
MKITKKQALEMYEKMSTIRAFEELVKREYLAGNLPGFVHLYIGEEAVASGVCYALEDRDYIESTHRGHGHCIAKGADLNRMMAEIYGKGTGLCKGKGGSMHIADFNVGMLGANGVVGGGYNLAAGAALASSRILKNDRVSVVFFGDGASNRGTFHEAANVANAWKLPMVFVNENNGWASTTPYRTTTAVENISDYASAYHMPAIIVDGSNVFEVYRAAREAVDRARRGEGPTFIEAKTFRVEGHFVRDPELYRTREYVEEQRKKHDPFAAFERVVLGENDEVDQVITKEELETIRKASEEKVLAAQKFALESPEPKAQEYLEDLYV